jgi:diacylglycerol O-acyltransferase
MIERTSPTDLMQLASELPGSPMQVAAVLVLGTAAPLDLSAVRDAIDRRLGGVPRLRQRLIRTPFGAGRPIWVDDPDFDIRHHVTGATWPAPGDETALLTVATGALTRRLPADRPLWSATLVTSVTGGDTALIVTLHHVLADGIGGLAVLAHLVDGAPAPSAVAGRPHPPPGRGALYVDACRMRLRAVAHLPSAVRRLCSAVTELAAGRTATPPRSSLNQITGPRRSLAVARADLASVQRAAHAHGATVNDVVLAAVSGALHALLRHRGEVVDRFVVSVPTSDRGGATAGRLGNHVGVMTVPIVAADSPLERLVAIARTTRRRRPAVPDASAALLGPAFRALAGLGVFEWIVDRQRLVTTMVTNLRGPERRLTFLAAPIIEVIPISPITGNVTVAFAVLSYAGTLVVTVVADPQHCPDLPVLLAQLRNELDRFTGERGEPGEPGNGGPAAGGPPPE